MPMGVYPRKKRPLTDRFWEKVDVKGPDDCWEWTASKTSTGYGQLRVGNGIEKAHRLAWKLANGSIPNNESHHGTCVLHCCDNKLCCNPAHLFLGTQTENLADMAAKNRGAKGSALPQTKLVEKEVLAIRQSNLKQRILATLYSVSLSNISAIRRRLSWRWLA